MTLLPIALVVAALAVMVIADTLRLRRER